MSRLLSSLPVGAKIKDTGSKYYGQPILFTVMEHGHTDDPGGSTALITSNIIALKCFDAKEASNSDSNRLNYGNNRYLYSNLKQWLNSEASAGAWYAAQHSTDAPPTNANVDGGYNDYDQQAGFLTNLSENFRNSLMTVTKRTARNTVTDGGGYEDVTQKVFLPSTTEVGLANENNIAEGSIYSLFSTSSNRIAKPTAQAVTNSEYTSTSLNSSSAWYWWLRTPYSGYSYYVRDVNTDGSLNGSIAYHGYYGVRPACAVSSSILVSDEAGSDGAYTIVWNAPPAITTESESLGDKNAPFNVSFSIVDADADAVSVTVKLDAAVVQTINTVDQTTNYTYAVSGVTLNSLSNGSHTITITATDAVNNTSTKTITFNKTTSPVTISGTDRDIGNVWLTPTITYQVDDSTSGTTINVVETIDGETTHTWTNVGLNTDIEVDFTSFTELENETVHTLTITATDSNMAMTIRTITFKKLGDKIKFYTDAVTTDEAARKIVVEVNYSTENNPEIKVEVTNDALAVIPAWEDATEAYNNNTFYNFTNKPTTDFGISVKVTLTKNENTERIYVDSMGFSFY